MPKKNAFRMISFLDHFGDRVFDDFRSPRCSKSCSRCSHFAVQHRKRYGSAPPLVPVGVSRCFRIVFSSIFGPGRPTRGIVFTRFRTHIAGPNRSLQRHKILQISFLVPSLFSFRHNIFPQSAPLSQLWCIV